MRKDFGAKPFLYPQPVMIIGTYDKDGKPNAMNAAWGGIVGANEIIIDLSSHCLLCTSPRARDRSLARMPSSA